MTDEELDLIRYAHRDCAWCRSLAPELRATEGCSVARLVAEVEKLRALVGDPDYDAEHWKTCTREEAIRQANDCHHSRLQWIEEHDARRDERDRAQKQGRKLCDALIALRPTREDGTWPPLDMPDFGREAFLAGSETALRKVRDVVKETTGYVGMGRWEWQAKDVPAGSWPQFWRTDGED